MPRHIEQPDSRHSAPASMNTRSRPSASAARLTCCEPGTTSIDTPGAMLAPAQHAAPRRAGPRGAPLVQLPRNTTLTGWSLMGAPAPAPCTRARGRRPDPPAGAGSCPPIGIDHAGVGAVGDHRLDGRGVELDFAVEARARHRSAAAASCSSARSQAAPCGARGRPLQVVDRSSRPARSCRRARRPRSTCCRRSCARPCRERAMVVAAVLDDVAGAAGDADPADDGEDQVLGGDARGAARRAR